MKAETGRETVADQKLHHCLQLWATSINVIYENGDPQQIHNTEYANKYSQNKTVNSLGKQFTVD